MNDKDNIRQDYLALLEQVNNVQMATLSHDATPEASYAPCVWFEGDCHVLLSELASHTRNLQLDPSIGLLLIEPEAAAGNAFSRKRISLFGSAQMVARSDATYKTVIKDFYHRFGDVMQLIEPLPDFHLFRIVAQRGRFIRGFGQAYELLGEKLERLVRIEPGK